MEQEHITQLEMLLRYYGAYEVIKHIAAIEKEMAVNMNPEAVINRDIPVIDAAIIRMEGNHPLRSLIGK